MIIQRLLQHHNQFLKISDESIWKPFINILFIEILNFMDLF